MSKPSSTFYFVGFCLVLQWCLILGQSPISQHTITLTCKDQPLRTVLEEITKQTEAKFVYDDELVDGKTVTCRFDSTSLQKVLQRITEETELSFKFQSDQRIVLYKKISNQSERGIIKGRVVDASSKIGLEGANIFLSGTSIGSSTNENGEFTISNIPGGSYNLNCMFIGYEEEEISNIYVSKETQAHFDIEMDIMPVRLREIVVTPSRFAIMGSTPTVSQTLTRKDIETIPQFGDDIYRAVKRLPGLTSHEFSSRFTVRGGEHNQILALIDGLELYEPFHLKDVFGGALSIIDAAAIEGIDMMTGSFPVEYGDRLSGVFNITSRNPDADQQKYAMSFSFMNARILSEGSYNNNKGTWMFTARRGYLNHILKISGLYDYQPGLIYYDFLGKVENQINERNKLAVHVLHANDRIEFIEENVLSMYGNTYGWLTLQSIINPRIYVQTVISTGRISHDRQGSKTINEFEHYSNSDMRNFSFYGFKQDWNLKVSNISHLKFGYEIKAFISEYDYTRIYQKLITPESLTTKIVTNPSGQKVNAYFANRFKLFSPLTIELGCRYDYASYSNDNLISPRLNVVYALGRKTCIRGGWGHFYQSQGIHELHVQDEVDIFFPAEHAEHRVIGFEHTFPWGIRMRLEGYYKKLSDLRPVYRNWRWMNNILPELESDRLQLFLDGSTARGIEVYLKKDAGRKITWWASYGLSHVNDKIAKIVHHDGGTVHYNTQLPSIYDQRHTFYFDLNYRLNSKWQFNLAWQYHTGCPYTDLVTVAEQNYKTPTMGDYNSKRYPPYHRLDVRINRHIDSSRGRITAYLEIMNVYNRKNVAFYDYSYSLSQESPTRYTIKKSPVHWFPLLPAIGLSWSWGGQ